MLMMDPPLCMRGTAYLIPKKGPRSKRAIDRSKPSTDVSAIRSGFATRSRIAHYAIELTEMSNSEAHQGFNIGRTHRVSATKRRIFTKFIFKMLCFVVYEVAKDNSSAFFHETLSDACAYASSATRNDRDL